jgi:hypothetical protein
MIGNEILVPALADELVGSYRQKTRDAKIRWSFETYLMQDHFIRRSVAKVDNKFVQYAFYGRDFVQGASFLRSKIHDVGLESSVRRRHL